LVPPPLTSASIGTYPTSRSLSVPPRRKNTAK
jgi:hypothetical protein